MRKIRHIAAMAAGTSVLALGGVAAGTGYANASTNWHVTSCNDTVSTLSVGAMPSCTSQGTVRYPTTIKLTVNSDQLSTLLNPVLSGVGQGIKDNWSLSCYAGSARIINESGTFKVTSSQRSTTTRLPLHGQTPSDCRVRATVSTLIGVNVGLLGGIASLGVSDNVRADTASVNATRNVKAGGGWCADVWNDRDAVGNKIQAWKCISDPAQQWIWSPKRELVHEGRCLGYGAAGAVVLQACTGAPDQIWNSNGAWRELWSSGGKCLTIPTYRNGTQLHAYTCHWNAKDRWTVPKRASY